MSQYEQQIEHIESSVRDKQEKLEAKDQELQDRNITILNDNVILFATFYNFENTFLIHHETIIT